MPEILSEHADPSLYALVHELVAPDAGEERRGRDRRSFPTVQTIAPYDVELPKRDQFHPVRCQDLSTGGMSFFADEPPTFDRLVVGLSSASQMVYLTAAVAHHKTVEVGDEMLILVGCRFLGRVIL